MDTNSLGYISKEEKKIPINDPTGKWSDLTLLPEWSEKYHDVYTVRKHGKWVMLKALKSEYADDPEWQARLEKEFDTRYNLAHANIVMVNDFEDVPGVGRAIITDDVYGYSLRRLIDEHRLTPRIVQRLRTQLLDAMEYIQENRIVHSPITPDNIIFTEYTENLKLINVGYDQSKSVSDQSAADDIRNYGLVLTEVLDHLPTSMPRLRAVANQCKNGTSAYRSITDLQLAVENRSPRRLYTVAIFFLAIIATLLFILVLR